MGDRLGIHGAVNFSFVKKHICSTFPPTKRKAYSTVYSQAVTHPSTNTAQPCLTSVIRRELVHSRWYGRRHFYDRKCNFINLKLLDNQTYAMFAVSECGRVILVVECRRWVRGAVVWECWLLVQDAANRCHHHCQPCPRVGKADIIDHITPGISGKVFS